MDNRHIVFFDGVCNFCNGAANFIIKRDPTGQFAFAPVQSPVGQELIKKYGAALVGIDTFLQGPSKSIARLFLSAVCPTPVQTIWEARHLHGTRRKRS